MDGDGDRNFIIIDFVGNGNNGFSFGTSLGDSVGDGQFQMKISSIRTGMGCGSSKPVKIVKLGTLNF